MKLKITAFITALIVVFGSVLLVQGADYAYQLGTFEERAQFAVECGLVDNQSAYYGTAKQNLELLKCGTFGSGGEELEPTSIGTGATSADPNVTYVTDVTDDFAVGGTDSSAPLYFDTSAGSLNVNNSVSISTSTPWAGKELALNGDMVVSGGQLLISKNVTEPALVVDISGAGSVLQLKTDNALRIDFSVSGGNNVIDGQSGNLVLKGASVRVEDSSDEFIVNSHSSFATTTATTTPDIWVAGQAAQPTSTVSIGSTGIRGQVDGCIELAENGTIYRIYINGGNLVSEVGRCK